MNLEGIASNYCCAANRGSLIRVLATPEAMTICKAAGSEVWSRALDCRLVRVPEKWVPVFRKDMHQRKSLEHFPIALTRSVVIAELDPAIHPLRKKMDARVKPAHDGGEIDAAKPENALVPPADA